MFLCVCVCEPFGKKKKYKNKIFLLLWVALRLGFGLQDFFIASKVVHVVSFAALFAPKANFFQGAGGSQLDASFLTS